MDITLPALPQFLSVYVFLFLLACILPLSFSRRITNSNAVKYLYLIIVHRTLWKLLQLMCLTILVNFMFFEDRSRSTKCIANTKGSVTWRNLEKKFKRYYSSAESHSSPVVSCDLQNKVESPALPTALVLPSALRQTLFCLCGSLSFNHTWLLSVLPACFQLSVGTYCSFCLECYMPLPPQPHRNGAYFSSS